MLHSTSFFLRGRAIARPSCDYTIDFGCGGVIIGEVDGIVDNKVALQSSSENPTVYCRLWIIVGHFPTPFLTESIGKRWFDEANTTTDR